MIAFTCLQSQANAQLLAQLREWPGQIAQASGADNDDASERPADQKRVGESNLACSGRTAFRFSVLGAVDCCLRMLSNATEFMRIFGTVFEAFEVSKVSLGVWVF